jgi:hypothetical protein
MISHAHAMHYQIKHFAIFVLTVQDADYVAQQHPDMGNWGRKFLEGRE